MHRIFVLRATAPPSRSVASRRRPGRTSAPGSTRAARAFADAAGFEPRAGRHLLLPAPDGALAGVLFGLDADDNPARDPFAAGSAARPAAERHVTGSPIRPAMTRARGARLRARQLPVRALPQARRQGGPARAAGRRRRRGPVAHRRRRLPRPRSHQHAGQRHGPGRARGGGARSSPSSTAPPFARSSATTCWRENFPLIHAVGRAASTRAAADRPDAGATRPRPRSRWSARACASTPAGSTSSPTAPCC